MAQKKHKLTKTEKVIQEMLTENTGRHFLDSGGTMNTDGSVSHGYGRHWERNQKRDFASEPRSTLEWDYGSVSVTHNVYHWLVDRLEYDGKLDRRFRKWAATEERSDWGWLQCMEAWCDELKEQGCEITGIHGDDSQSHVTVNTYNGEDLLSQTLQYCYFELDGESYVLLQIHGGCDVRGGYTAPRVFKIEGPGCGEGTEIFDNARAGIGCCGVETNPNQTEIPGCEAPLCERSWYTDDGHNWYSNDQHPDLTDYPVTTEENGETWEHGSVHVCENGDILCPNCGGKLCADFY